MRLLTMRTPPIAYLGALRSILDWHPFQKDRGVSVNLLKRSETVDHLAVRNVPDHHDAACRIGRGHLHQQIDDIDEREGHLRGERTTLHPRTNPWKAFFIPRCSDFVQPILAKRWGEQHDDTHRTSGKAVPTWKPKQVKPIWWLILKSSPSSGHTIRREKSLYTFVNLLQAPV